MRRLARWWLAECLFDRFRWFRRWRGGHWELWYVEVTASEIWHHVPECSRATSRRPPCCRGTPRCEDYPPQA